MLKPVAGIGNGRAEKPAAFRRLCVETDADAYMGGEHPSQPPSGGCVLKPPD